MDFTDQETQEFKIEAVELLDSAERELLALESDGSFQAHYDAVFRVFHSLKGGAGMLGLKALQTHMHSLESLFSKLKTEKTVDKSVISFFLNGADAARRILNGESVEFDFNIKKSPSPLKPVPPKEESSSQKKPTTQTKVARKDLNLVYSLDDEPEILEIIEETLSSENVACRTFTDPFVCIQAISEHPPSAVIVDLKMPEMSGLEVLKEIHKIDPDIPVILLSGYLDKGTLLESIRVGVFGALEKPFDTRQLLSLVFNAIRQRELLRLLNQSINLILYQFSDLDDFLKEHGKEDIRKSIRTELSLIHERRKKLKPPVSKPI